MATREEIREGLAVKLAFYQGRDYWKMTEVDKEYWLTQSYGALEYLHSQGARLRVEGKGEMVNYYDGGFSTGYGYPPSAFEPLIDTGG